MIIRDGEIIKVPARALQALAYFITHAGSVVTYNQINTDIGPGKFSENGFYQLIALLRKVLSDDSKNPKFIKTIAKQGYMFIGIDSVRLKSSVTKLANATVSKKVSKRVNTITLLAMGIFAAVVVAMINYSWTLAEDDSHAALYDLIDNLTLPESTVIVERLEIDDNRLQITSDALVLLSHYHLASRSSQHVAITPKYNNSAIGTGAEFYKKLLLHYRNSSSVSYIFRPQVSFDSSGAWLFLLTQINAKTQDVIKVFEFSSQPGDLSKAVSLFEKKCYLSFGCCRC